MAEKEPTLGGLLLARADDDRPALYFEDSSWTWRAYVAECARRAARLDRLSPVRPLHVGVLLANVPEMLFLLGAAALSRHVVVALNPTRGPASVAADAAATDVDVVVHDEEYADLAAGLDLPVVELHGDAATPECVASPDDLVMLIFTSGTSGRPRAVRVTQRKIALPGTHLAAMLTPDDVVYCSMPLFHSGAVMAAWAPAVASGAAIVLRRRFSASGLLPDARRYGCTYLHYVGKALSYVLATPERNDDLHNPLRIAFGNEGSATAIRRFGERYGCRVIDGFGSTETGISFAPDPQGPDGSLGRAAPGVKILSPATGRECPPARFGGDGRLLNPDEAIGELVNTAGTGLFAGYYNDPEAEAERVRDGTFWSGDYAYADADGHVYFAGRGTERLRVDGENLAVAPIESALREFPGVIEAAVYPVPDPEAGDQVMAALVIPDFDPAGFAKFLEGRGDLGAKAIPRYVRICRELPQLASHKVAKRRLIGEGWRTSDPVWWRPTREFSYRPLLDPREEPDGLRA